MSLFHNGEDVLTKEIESWKGFKYILEKKIDFSLTRCYLDATGIKDYVKATSSKGESYTAE